MEQQVEAGRPFYLQVSHYAVHIQLMSLAKTVAKYGDKDAGKWHHRPLFGGCAEDLDTGIGMLLDKIEELGIADNTYVFYMADNGAEAIRGNRHLRNMPLRRGKFTFFEGGIRVPMFAMGPGIKPGEVCESTVWGCDLLPTLHDLSGSRQPMPKGIDGGSLGPIFAHGGEGEVERANIEGLVFHCAAGARWSGTRRQSAIRSGDYMLMKNYYNGGEVLLFNVKDDPYEWHDLSGKLPEKRDELLAKLEGYLERVEAVDARMTDEEVAAMQNADTLAAERAEGWRGYSRPGRPTEYPVSSFSDGEKDPKPYAHGVKPE